VHECSLHGAITCIPRNACDDSQKRFTSFKGELADLRFHRWRGGGRADSGERNIASVANIQILPLQVPRMRK